MATNKTTKVEQKSSPKTDEEKLAGIAHLEYQMVKIVKGKKFPVGETFECVKIGLNKWHQPYVLITVDDSEEFCDPNNLQVLKPISPARVALIKSRLEEEREATMIVGGTIRGETEKAVGLRHHNWFKVQWFPKSLISVLGEHEDGEQTLYEVPRWKIALIDGPRGVDELEALQESYQTMLAPKPKARPDVTGKTTLVRKGK